MSWLKDRVNAVVNLPNRIEEIPIVGKRLDQLVHHSVASDLVKAKTSGVFVGLTNATLGTNYQLGYGSGAENTLHKVNAVQGYVASAVLGVFTGGISTAAQGAIRVAASAIKTQAPTQTQVQLPANFQPANDQPPQNEQNNDTIIVYILMALGALVLIFKNYGK